MVSVKAVCNSILKRSFEDGIKVTPMKLQRIIYLVYKEYLKRTGCVLFRDNIQVWRTGPVVISIYDDYKYFKDKDITRFNRDIKGRVSVVSDIMILGIIDDIWDTYKNKSGIELSEVIRGTGGAWCNAWECNKVILDINDIIDEIVKDLRVEV